MKEQENKAKEDPLKELKEVLTNLKRGLISYQMSLLLIGFAGENNSHLKHFGLDNQLVANVTNEFFNPLIDKYQVIEYSVRLFATLKVCTQQKNPQECQTILEDEIDPSFLADIKQRLLQEQERAKHLMEEAEARVQKISNQPL